MVVFLIRAFIFLASAALGLWIASLVVDGFTVTASGFLVAVVVFAILQSILTPWFLVMSRKYANALTGAVGLVSTVAALFVATLVGDGLTISGATAWILGSFLVWIVTTVVFLAIQMVPGDPAEMLLSQGGVAPDRAIVIDGAIGWCLEPHDLAVSKLAAGREKDMAFVEVMVMPWLPVVR